YPDASAAVTPHAEAIPSVTKVLRMVHDEQGGIIKSDVAVVFEKRNDALDEFHIIIRKVFLLKQDFILRPIPPSGPVLVRQAQTERNVAARVRQHVIERPVQDALTREPIVMITKPIDAVLFGKRNLIAAGLAQPQVVEAEIGRQMGLVVAFE